MRFGIRRDAERIEVMSLAASDIENAMCAASHFDHRRDEMRPMSRVEKLPASHDRFT